MGTSSSGEIVGRPLLMRPRPDTGNDQEPTRVERRLVARARRGSAAAIEELIRRHWDGAHRAASLILGDPLAAEDIAQESLLRAVRSLSRFDPGRRFAPWLHRITVNRSLDHVRAKSRRPPLASDQRQRLAEAEVRSPGPSAADPALTAALQQLDPEDRAIVVLRHVLGSTSAEIGETLGLPAGTVRRRLAEAMVVLRRELEAETRSAR